MADVAEALRGLLELCVDDPTLFFREFLRVRLRTWQQNVCDEIRAQLLAKNFRIAVLIRSCHGAGKTWFVAGLLLWFVVTRPKSRGVTTAPTWKQVEDLLWGDVAALYRGSLLAGRFGRVLSTRFDTGDKEWFASGVSSDHFENIEGQHSTVAAIRIVDEAKAVEQDMFDATDGIFTAPETLDVWISTPSIESGPFYERDVNGPESVIRAVVDIDDLIGDQNVPQAERRAFEEWKEERKKAWGESSSTYQSRVLAKYAKDAEGSLFPSGWVETAMAHEFEIAAPVRAGMDCAGSIDGDENAVAVVAGPDGEDRLHVHSIESWHERDTMLSKGRAMALTSAPLRVDVIGLGKGIADALHHDGRDVEEYRASDAPRDTTRFANRKAEDCWALRDLMEAKKLRLPNSQKLKTQFCAMRYEISTNGKIKIVDPPDSPDLADAVVIACAGPRTEGIFDYYEKLAREANGQEVAA